VVVAEISLFPPVDDALVVFLVGFRAAVVVVAVAGAIPAVADEASNFFLFAALVSASLPSIWALSGGVRFPTNVHPYLFPFGCFDYLYYYSAVGVAVSKDVPSVERVIAMKQLMK